MTSVTDALGWLAGAFYVIVALSIVYLFFFRIVPLVLGKISWDLWSLVRGILVLAALAFLLGCVAIFTADWIFSQVLDTLPRTRMAREVDRVTGSLVRLSVDTPYNTSTTGAGQFFNFAPPANGVQGAAPGGYPAANPFPGSTVEPGVAPLTSAERPLRENALDLWATLVQNKYNASGKVSDNMLVMNKRDIPQGVVCDVAAASSGYWPKRYEEWRLVCSRDNFRSSIVIQVNGTAARGLTGGSFYSLENPFTVYGTGLWPDAAYDTQTPQATPEADPADGEATPQGGPVLQETPGPGRVHTVRPGESLALIAKQYSVQVAKLVAANEIQYPQLQTNPNVIVVGWVLSIPE